MVIEGMLALTGQHFIINYNEEHGHAARRSSRASTTSPATSTATSPSARASCARWRARTRRYARRDPAHAGRGGAGRRRRAHAAVVRGGHGAVRRVARRDARVRDEGARAAAEGDRARAGRPSQAIWLPSSTSLSGAQQHDALLVVERAEHEHLGREARDPLGGKFTTADDRRPIELLARVVGDLRR